jgi:hypothetical protein
VTPEQEELQVRLEEIYGAHLSAANTVAAFTDDANASLLNHADYVVKAKKILDAKNAVKYPGLAGRPPPSLGEMFSDENMRDSFIEHRASIIHLYPNLLTEMAFIYRVALFDAYVPDMIKAVLLKHPEILKNKDKQLSYEEILNLHEKGALVESLVGREVDRISRESTRKQIAWISSKLHVSYLENEEQENVLVEMTARRNILVHNNAIVNEQYLHAVPKSSLVLGERIIIDHRYWGDCNRFLRNATITFVLALARRYCPGSYPDP